jgi:hypothetical protein
VNGQWVKGVGGVPVWAAIKAPDVPGTARFAGVVNADGSIADGSGFTVAHVSLGNYTITFASTLNVPIVVATPLVQSVVCGCGILTGSSVTVFMTTPTAWVDCGFSFAAFMSAGLP